MKKNIEDIDLTNKIVIIRVDYNVPIKNSKVLDDTRIKASLKTINYCLKQNSKIVLLSHLGRIKEEDDKEKNSLLPVAQILSNLLNKKILFSSDFDNAKKIINDMEYGNILLLENTRWFDYPKKLESECDKELSKYFASLGEVFVNDAFGTIHRCHASNYGISSILPSVTGFLVQEELNNLSKLNNPEHPYTLILGGSKVSDKIGVITTLIKKCDYLLIGGGMAFTFLAAKGIKIGKSIIDVDNIDFCKNILDQYNDKIILPIDVRVSSEFNDLPYKEVEINLISENEFGLDIGSKTIELFKEKIKISKTIMWNGPLGVYEFKNYQNGTKEILDVVSNVECFSVLGGGDIVAACNTLGYNNKISHISTGGGATLEYLEGKELPGLINILEK